MWDYAIPHFPVTRILEALNRAESTGQDRWGGSDTIGGSPRVAGSTLEPDAVARVVDAVVAEENAAR